MLSFSYHTHDMCNKQSYMPCSGGMVRIVNKSCLDLWEAKRFMGPRLYVQYLDHH
jgi:hypothetical protein